MADTSIIERLTAHHGDAFRVGGDCDLADDLIVELDEGAVLRLGDRVSIRRGTTIQVHRGATVAIGNDVAIGEHTFLSAMVGIRIGDGAALSNMVDLHDHNHREPIQPNLAAGGPQLVPWASGFAAAPIVIEAGALISNKVTITAGVRVGQNTMIGAGATVTRSIPPNRVAAGTPATVKRGFDAPLRGTDPRLTVAFAWYGTSIMQHLEGSNTRMTTQADLPQIGSSVTVEDWVNRGYVHRLRTTLQTRHPHLVVRFDNHGEGGATSRDILTIVRDNSGGHDPNTTVSMLGCGINDVWRHYQGRHREAVALDEFTDNYRRMLQLLTPSSRQVICIAETPFGWDDTIDLAAANQRLQEHNAAAAQLAAEHGAAFIDVWAPFTTTARLLQATTGASLWSDGVHLSEHGDALLHDLVDAHLRDAGTVDRLTTYPPVERDTALARYRPLFDDIRSTPTATPTC